VKYRWFLAEGQIQSQPCGGEFGFQPTIRIYALASWGVAPGYVERGLRPNDVIEMRNFSIREAPVIRLAVTICLVPEACGGPFVLWDDLATGCETAARLGFEGVELFVPSADAVDSQRLHQLLGDYGLSLAAVGTGAGWLLHGLHLADEDGERRARACDYVRSIIDFAGALGAPAIIGSMQGRSSENVTPSAARDLLRDALDQLGQHATQYHVPVLIEPLNRYETDVTNTLAEGFAALEGIANVQILADLFHMNIEESDMASAIERAGASIGHVHFVDSNRQAVGRGHLAVEPIAAALKQIQYDGYLSAEALPLPDPLAAAAATINAFRKYFR
jgi:sugar phosphate isomerase/epimerase